MNISPKPNPNPSHSASAKAANFKNKIVIVVWLSRTWSDFILFQEEWNSLWFSTSLLGVLIFFCVSFLANELDRFRVCSEFEASIEMCLSTWSDWNFHSQCDSLKRFSYSFFKIMFTALNTYFRSPSPHCIRWHNPISSLSHPKQIQEINLQEEHAIAFQHSSSPPTYNAFSIPISIYSIFSYFPCLLQLMKISAVFHCQTLMFILKWYSVFLCFTQRQRLKPSQPFELIRWQFQLSSSWPGLDAMLLYSTPLYTI